MPRRVLILRSDALEQELEAILNDLGHKGRTVNIEPPKLGKSPEAYRSEILSRASAAGIDQFHCVVLFVSPPGPSTAGTLELRSDDLGILTHLTEQSWMDRMILIQKDKADAGDLWGVFGRPGAEMKPRHAFGRPHGRDCSGNYVLQVARAISGRQDEPESRWMERLLEWLGPSTKKASAKLVAAVISALVAFVMAAFINYVMPTLKEVFRNME